MKDQPLQRNKRKSVSTVITWEISLKDFREK
jgi:hypothetical protein